MQNICIMPQGIENDIQFGKCTLFDLPLHQDWQNGCDVVRHSFSTPLRASNVFTNQLSRRRIIIIHARSEPPSE